MDTGTNMPPQIPPMPAAPQSGGNAGAMIGVGVIVIVLALGAVYFWMDSRPMADIQEATTETSYTQTDATAEALKQTGTSDTASDIEADLSATELGDIEAEMNAASSGI